jgi:hypothetical protein
MALRKPWAHSLAGAGLALLAFAQLVAFVFAQVEWGMRCNESCKNAAGWTNSANSWQWSVLFWLPVAALVATGVGGYAIERSPPIAKLAIVVSIAASVSWMVLVLASNLHFP